MKRPTLKRPTLKRPTRRQAIMIVVGTVVAALVVIGLLPGREPVQTAIVAYGPLQVVVEEEGETDVEDRYVITTPVPAYLRRVEFEVGDVVEAGQPVVQLEPPRATILDPRARAEAQARVEVAQAGVAQAEQHALAAEATAERATLERERVARLQAGGSATRQALEAATAEAALAVAERDAARDAVQAAQAELRGARDALGARVDSRTLPVQEVLRAPASGRVLAVHQESEGHVNPGEPLVEIGDTERLQVRVAVLSQDAVNIRPGTRVFLDQWGGHQPIEATVRRVDPQGFTQVSALGVEEQRVWVTADIVRPDGEDGNALGSGYRVLARFVVWEGARVLQVPSGALFRHEEGWAVFVVEGGRAVLRPVSVGAQAGLAAQILDGLGEGDEVILHPGLQIEDGTRVSPED